MWGPADGAVSLWEGGSSWPSDVGTARNCQLHNFQRMRGTYFISPEAGGLISVLAEGSASLAGTAVGSSNSRMTFLMPTRSSLPYASSNVTRALEELVEPNAKDPSELLQCCDARILVSPPLYGRPVGSVHFRQIGSRLLIEARFFPKPSNYLANEWSQVWKHPSTLRCCSI